MKTFLTARAMPCLLTVLLATTTLACSSAADDDAASSGPEDLVKVPSGGSTSAGELYADGAIDALMNQDWNASAHDFAQTNPSNGQKTISGKYWLYAQAFHAVLDGVTRARPTNDTEWVAQAKEIFAGWTRAEGSGLGLGKLWFDDENWYALSFLEANDVLGKGPYLSDASATFDDIWARGRSWDADGSYAGIYECIDANLTNSCKTGGTFHSKAAVSNFGPAMTAAKLYGETGERLAEAKQIYAWSHANLWDAQRQEIYDHIAENGDKVAWAYTYNYGVAIGAAVALHQATKEATYLEDAYAFASAMLVHTTAAWEGKTILHDGAAATCDTSKVCDTSAFKGIGYRYLAALYELDTKSSNPTYDATIERIHAVLVASAQAVTRAQNKDNLYATDWAGGPKSFTTIGSQASAVTTLNVAVKLGLL